MLQHQHPLTASWAMSPSESHQEGHAQMSPLSDYCCLTTGSKLHSGLWVSISSLVRDLPQSHWTTRRQERHQSQTADPFQPWTWEHYFPLASGGPSSSRCDSIVALSSDHCTSSWPFRASSRSDVGRVSSVCPVLPQGQPPGALLSFPFLAWSGGEGRTWWKWASICSLRTLY